MRFIAACLAFLIVGTPVAEAGPCGWREREPVPLGRIRYGHAQCDGRLYVLGGMDSTFNLTITAMVYDVSTGRWDSLAPLPELRESAAAVCVDGRLHLLGGSDRFANATTSHFVLEPGAKEWVKAAALPRPASAAAAGAAGGRIYLAGGDDDSFPGNGVSGEVNVYDIATDTWIGNAASMPAAATGAGSVQAGQFLYLAGGWDRNASQPPIKNLTRTQRLDLLKGTWSIGPDLPDAPADFALAATGQALYAIGGDADGGGFFDSSTRVRRLGLKSWPGGAWEDDARPLPVPLAANSAGFCAAGQLWSVGGALPGREISDKHFSRRHGEGCPAS